MISQLNDPFNSSVATDPWSMAAVDVPSIHQAVFDSCLATLSQVRQLPDMPTRSILIYGSAGSGKTHLLGRLRKAVVGFQPKQSAIFCYVRLTTSPAMICRHVRRCLTTDLLRPNQAGICQLDLVLLARLSKKLTNSDSAVSYLEQLRQSPSEQEKLSLAIASLDGEAGLGRNFSTACEHWLLRRHRRDVADWFREGDIPEIVRSKLGFVRDPVPSEESSEAAAYDMILRSTRLIGPVRPLMLCFDQIEALLPSDGNADGLTDFGRFVANLYEETRATLLVTCVQSAFQSQIIKQIREADRVRVAGETLEISPLSSAECESLAAAILDGTVDLASDDRRKRDRLWPLDRNRLEKLCENKTCTPRQLISYCRDAVRAWRSGKPLNEPPAPDLNRFLRSTFDERNSAYLGSINDSQTTLAHGLPQLVSLVGEAAIQPCGRPEIIECAFRKSGESILVSVCNQKHNSLPARLKRLHESDLPINQLVLVRDSTVPIPVTSKVARKRWTELQERGARIVRPSAEALAALEALRSVLSDAKSGDLSSDGETIEPSTVEEWIRSQLLDEELQRLVAEILHSPSEIIQNDPDQICPDPLAADEIFNDLLEGIQRLHIASVDSIASALNRTSAEVLSCAKIHPAELGLIGDPPSVIFEKCTAVSREGN